MRADPRKGYPIKTTSLVLLPGLDGTGILFRPLLAALPANIRATVVKYPWDRPLTYEQLLPIVLDALPRDEPFVLLGESFSGPLAAMAAATKPKNLAGVIFAASFVSCPQPIFAPVVRALAHTPPFWLFPPAQIMKTKLCGDLTPEMRTLFFEVRRQMRAKVIAFRVRMIFRTDMRESLRRCDVPILYIAGRRDTLVPARNYRLIRQFKPETRVEKIDSRHMVLQSRPAESAAAIVRFVESLV